MEHGCGTCSPASSLRPARIGSSSPAWCGFLVDAGVHQFLDIGTGFPTTNNTHSVAQERVPEARVVYVDNDPFVLVHARALLTRRAREAIGYVEAGVRDPDRILHAATATLDFHRPVGGLMLDILNFVLDDAEAQRSCAG